MFEVKVQGRFSAAHNLRDYEGDCENLHGHNWLVEISITGKRSENGMVMDFRVLKKALSETLAELDHQYLNKLEYFKTHNTTTENITEYIYSEVSSRMPEGIKVNRVTAWESQGSGISYYPDNSQLNTS